MRKDLEGFFINPPRQRKRRFVIGRVGSKHRPTVYTVRHKGRKRWRTSPKAKITRKGLFINPFGESLVTVGGNPMARRRGRRGRRYRRNPARLGIRGMARVQDWAPLAVTGGLSAIATGVVPGMLGLINPWVQYGAKLGSAFLGGMGVRQFVGAEHGNVWMIVGVSLVGYDLLKEFVLKPFFPAIALGNAYGDYRFDESAQAQMQAYPEEVSAYPEEMAAYPYDGRYPY